MGQSTSGMGYRKEYISAITAGTGGVLELPDPYGE